MSAIKWGTTRPIFDMGVECGVLYDSEGYHPWNGLVAVQENGPDAAEVDLYFEGSAARIRQRRSDNFSGVVEAYTYPDTLEVFDDEMKPRAQKSYDFTYRTDTEIHLVYRARFDVSAKMQSTLAGVTPAQTFKWDISTQSVPIPGARPTSKLTIDIVELEEIAQYFEDVLYGTESTNPRMPTPQELVQVYEDATSFRVSVLGNGTWEAVGNDDQVYLNADGDLVLDVDSAILMELGAFTVSSM